MAVVLLAGFALWSGWTRRADPSVAAGAWRWSASSGRPALRQHLQRPEDQWLAGAFADSLTLGLRDADNLVLVNRARVVELSGTPPAQADGDALARMVRTLAVRYYVDGSYQRAGEDIRVVARLVDADGHDRAAGKSDGSFCESAFSAGRPRAALCGGAE